MQKKSAWQWKIKAHSGWFQWNLHELWNYKDLLRRFVRRDLIASYQQTLLGPFWIFLQPLLTTLVYWLIFSVVARVSTDGIPAILFYLPGIIAWSYFLDCLNAVMYTFVNNTSIFAKIYFPRLVVPISSTVTHTVRMLVQLLLFVFMYIYFCITGPVPAPGLSLLLLPFLLLITASFSLGIGLTMSVITARFRDLDYALQYILRLFMFATPIVYPASLVPEKFRNLYWLNPLTPIVETFRSIFFNHTPIQWTYLGISACTSIVLGCFGITLFKKWEANITDII